MNLKELKEALNSMPESHLERTAIATDSCTESPSRRFCLLIIEDEENWHGESKEAKSFKKFRESKGYKEIVSRLIEFLNNDLEALKKREGEEGYDEEYGLEPDW